MCCFVLQNKSQNINPRNEHMFLHIHICMQYIQYQTITTYKCETSKDTSSRFISWAYLEGAGEGLVTIIDTNALSLDL